MRISLFTPTHKPLHLARLARSIAEQTFDDFEWVIVPNGGISPTVVDQILGELPPEYYRALLPKIRVVPYSGKTQNIGEIKNFCCQAARGEVLAEADHDDELTPDCLSELAEAFADPSVDFAYSHCAEVRDGKPYTYSEAFGWQYRPFEWRGRSLLEAIAFDPSPAAFSKIWFAPNHIRAWRAAFYREIGGHDKSFDVLDDQDLLARTYIRGTVRKIEKCLYVYHYTGQNTCQGEKNAKIQELCLELHDRYIYGLVERWCDLNGLAKVDLCGGFDPPPGYTSIDRMNGDITYDLELPDWPIGDGTVGVVRAHDALEHMRDPINTMKEIHRILAPNGWLLSQTPSTDGRGAFQDPTHRSFWNSNSMWYYTRARQARYINTPVRFQLNRIKNFYPTEWHQAHQILYVKADLLKFHGRVAGAVEI
jgi:O-antigen biosynthesis protein